MQTNLDAMSISPGQVPASKGRLLVVSNRGPVEYTVDDDGDLQKRSAGGGLATALTCVAKSKPVTWIASAGTPADRLAASAGPTNLGEDRRLRLVAPSPEAYSLFYASFCNPLLWFLQHSLWDQLQRPHPEAEAQLAWERGYLPVNQAFDRGGSRGALPGLRRASSASACPERCCNTSCTSPGPSRRGGVCYRAPSSRRSARGSWRTIALCSRLKNRLRTSFGPARPSSRTRAWKAMAGRSSTWAVAPASGSTRSP